MTVIPMSTDVAHKSWWQIFEVVFGIPFLVAISLYLALPLSFSLGSFTLAIILGGVALIVVGAVLVALARRELAQRGQPTDSALPTSKIVTTGVFLFQGIHSTSAAFAFWRGLLWHSISPGCYCFSCQPSSPATTFSYSRKSDISQLSLVRSTMHTLPQFIAGSVVRELHARFRIHMGGERYGRSETVQQ